MLFPILSFPFCCQGLGQSYSSTLQSTWWKFTLIFQKIYSQIFLRRKSINQWHQHLGHPHEFVSHKVISSSLLPVSSLSFNKCTSCLVGKSVSQHLYPTNTKCTQPHELIHSDVWGLAPMFSLMAIFFSWFLLTIFLVKLVVSSQTKMWCFFNFC